jgi:hypothetical protein
MLATRSLLTGRTRPRTQDGGKAGRTIARKPHRSSAARNLVPWRRIQWVETEFKCLRC